MKTLIRSAIASLMFVASIAIAGDALDGFAIGVSAARADVDINDAGVNVNGNSTGYRLFGRYQFTETFGLEAGYSVFDEPDDASLPSNMEVQSDSVDLFATGTLPLSDKLDMFGKAGVMRWSTETEVGKVEQSSSHTELALGIGGEYGLNDRFAIRSEFLWSEGQNSGGIRSLSLSGVYEF